MSRFLKFRPRRQNLLYSLNILTREAYLSDVSLGEGCGNLYILNHSAIRLRSETTVTVR